MTTSKQQAAYPLRFPADLREQLEERARDNKRSLNAELLARLEASLHSSQASSSDTASPLANAMRNVEAARNSLNVAMEELAHALIGENRSTAEGSTNGENFAVRLVRFRATAGMTQLDLAKASGVSIAQVGRYETGTSTPRISAITKLAKALNVPTSALE